MRKLLYEAAQSMMKRVAKWCWLKAGAMNIARRHGSKKAKVASARRLAVMHRMLYRLVVMGGLNAGPGEKHGPRKDVER